MVSVHPVGFGTRSAISVLNQFSGELVKIQIPKPWQPYSLQVSGIGAWQSVFLTSREWRPGSNHCAKGQPPNPRFQEGGFSPLARGEPGKRLPSL